MSGIDTMITDRQFQSTRDVLEIAKMANAVSDCELYKRAMDFYYLETSLTHTLEILIRLAIKAAEKEDWDKCRHWVEDVYSFMPVTWARIWKISSLHEAKLIFETLHNREIVDIADKGSAANLLAVKALEYIFENGSRGERFAVVMGTSPQLCEILTSPLGITDNGWKVIDLEGCAKTLSIPVKELLEMLDDSDFLPKRSELNLIHKRSKAKFALNSTPQLRRLVKGG